MGVREGSGRPLAAISLKCARALVFMAWLLLWALPVQARTDEPDDDQTNLNNDFSTAADIGLLNTAVGPDGTAAVTVKSGQLGVIQVGGGQPDGFDSVDMYRFSLPDDSYEVHFRSDETPVFTSFVKVYDANRMLIYESINNDNEDFRLDLIRGAYYVAVISTPAVAGGRTLGYRLSLTPKLIPYPKTGGPSCAAAANLGKMPSNEDSASGGPRTVQGSVTIASPTAAYQFYTPNGGEFFLSPLARNDLVSATLYDRVSGGPLPLRPMAVGSPPTSVTLDPGYYCVVFRYASNIPAGPKNYRFQMNGAFSNLNPRRGVALSAVDIGPLVQNGGYATGWRYRQQPTDTNPHRVLEMSRLYTVREWTEPSYGLGDYTFTLAVPARIALGVTNLLAPLSVTIASTDGAVIATAEPQGQSLTDLLPPMKLDQVLPAGDYDLVVHSIGPDSNGTGFALQLMASPAVMTPRPGP